MELLPLGFFEWAESSFLGYIGKTYGGIYATLGQSVHLISLAVLGGAVLVSEFRLLGWVLRDVPSEVVAEQAHKWFKIALFTIIASGVFMAAAIAIKLYYNAAYWAKMYALIAGVLFVFLVRRPILRGDHSQINPWVLKLVAVASILVWVSVAATGRWIGFS